MVVAGAGFGKTTLLDEAMATPGPDVGFEVSVRIDPGDVSAARFGSRLLAALGVDSILLTDRDDVLDVMIDELWSCAPVQVSLVFDDLHEIGPDSEAIRLLRDLVRRLPANTHLLIGSRRLPEIGIARLALTQDAEVLRESDLRFTADELVGFAGAAMSTLRR